MGQYTWSCFKHKGILTLWKNLSKSEKNASVWDSYLLGITKIPKWKYSLCVLGYKAAPHFKWTESSLIFGNFQKSNFWVLTKLVPYLIIKNIKLLQKQKFRGILFIIFVAGVIQSWIFHYIVIFMTQKTKNLQSRGVARLLTTCKKCLGLWSLW